MSDCKCECKHDDTNSGWILFLLLLGFLFGFPTCNKDKTSDKPPQVEKTEEVTK